MKANKQWKEAERRLARFFGTRRRPLSGSNQGGGGSDDGLHPKLYLENKYGKKPPLFALYADTRDKAKKERRTPVIGLQKKGIPGILLVIHSSDFPAVIREYLIANPDKIPKAIPPTPSKKSKRKPSTRNQ